MRKIRGRFGAVAGITALMGMMVAAAIAAPAQTFTTRHSFTTLHSFDSTDGAYLYAGLIQATDGNLYGTTSDYPTGGGGTIFKITPNGTLTTLYSFCSQSPCTDGAYPVAPLVQGTGGNFYGTTQSGGSTDIFGTVFKITAAGTLTTLYSFCYTGTCPTGAYPVAGLIQATDGNFYGTTPNGADGSVRGEVFKMTPGGTLTVLYGFTGDASPHAGVIEATDGNFYGATTAGGASNQGYVFKITDKGVLTTLQSFDGTDGYYPNAALIQATDGNLYGTTVQGGTNPLGLGTIFKITTSGTFTTLRSFSGRDGAYPYGGLIQASDGNFYGTTAGGGTNAQGNVFKVTADGTVATVYSFCSQPNCTDGDAPRGTLVQDTNGKLYGTTVVGGTNGYGTVFSLDLGLGPFVETQPTFGKAGKVIKVLGTNLTGASSVTFNGTSAVFKVISPSLIGATVPTGATTGPVQVVTPSGTLTSNVNFHVEP